MPIPALCAEHVEGLALYLRQTKLALRGLEAELADEAEPHAEATTEETTDEIAAAIDDAFAAFSPPTLTFAALHNLVAAVESEAEMLVASLSVPPRLVRVDLS